MTPFIKKYMIKEGTHSFDATEIISKSLECSKLESLNKIHFNLNDAEAKTLIAPLLKKSKESFLNHYHDYKPVMDELKLKHLARDRFFALELDKDRLIRIHLVNNLQNFENLNLSEDETITQSLVSANPTIDGCYVKNILNLCPNLGKTAVELLPYRLLNLNDNSADNVTTLFNEVTNHHEVMEDLLELYPGAWEFGVETALEAFVSHLNYSHLWDLDNLCIASSIAETTTMLINEHRICTIIGVANFIRILPYIHIPGNFHSFITRSYDSLKAKLNLDLIYVTKRSQCKVIMAPQSGLILNMNMFYTIQNSSYFTLRFMENLFHIPQNTLGSINLKDLNYSIEFDGHPERSDSKIVESRNTANESPNNL